MKILNILVWNRAERRLRLVWRFIAQSLLMGLLLLLLQAGAASLFALVSSSSQAAAFPGDPAAIQDLATIPASGLAVVISVYFAARLLDKRRFADLGLELAPSWWADFGFGFGLGAFLMLLIFLAELVLGWIEIESLFYAAENTGFPGGLLLSLLIYCFVGIYEEIYSRGYLIKNLSEGLSNKLIKPRTAIVLACLLTSTYFGLLHSANPNAGTMAVINIGLAGILLSLGYLITGQLGLSIGLHISWNFFQGPIFGFPVSGISFSTGSLININQLGPAFWTGDSFGPEGGLLGTFAAALGLTLITLYKGRNAGIHLGLSQFQPSALGPGQRTSPAIHQEENGESIKHIIWDWNGTLLDDLDLCLEIINNMLDARNLPGITRESYREIFDFPVEDYYRRIGFDFSAEPFESVSDEFIKAYEKGRPNCALMPGTKDILHYIDHLGISQSILSASKGSYLARAVAEYGIEGYFSLVQGLDNHHAAGKLDLAKRFLDTRGLASGEMLLVGDTTHDAAIASELGLKCILIPNGHQDRRRLESTNFPLLNALLDLKDLFNSV